MTLQATHQYNEDELYLLKAGRAEAPPAGSAAGLFAALGLSPVAIAPGSGFDSPPDGGEAAPVSEIHPGASEPAAAAPVPAVAPAGTAVAPAPAKSGVFAKPVTWIAMGGAALLALAPLALSEGPSEPHGTSETRVTAGEQTGTTKENSDASTGSDRAREAGAESGAIQLADLVEEPRSAAKSKGTPPESLAASADTAPGSAAPSESTLKDELALIRKARTLLSAGDLSGCAAALSTHQKLFQPPRLAVEAQVLRVELLVKQGNIAQARVVAAPLLSGNSPYRARLEKLLSSP